MLPLIGAVASVAGGLLGGGGGGGGGGGAPVRQSQDGNTLSSGSGGFSVGGGAPKWVWPVVIGVVSVAVLFIWKPWKK